MSLLAVSEIFFPLRPILQLEGHRYTPSVLNKIVQAGGSHKSFNEASKMIKLFSVHGRVTILNLFFAKITDDGLSTLTKFSELTALSLGMTKITDAGMKHVAQCKKLRSLNLIGVPITDAGLANLSELAELRTLS